jgi:hypothetical protein
MEMGCRRGKVATGPRGEEWARKAGRSELEQAAQGEKRVEREMVGRLGQIQLEK